MSLLSSVFRLNRNALVPRQVCSCRSNEKLAVDERPCTAYPAACVGHALCDRVAGEVESTPTTPLSVDAELSVGTLSVVVQLLCRLLKLIPSPFLS